MTPARKQTTEGSTEAKQQTSADSTALGEIRSLDGATVEQRVRVIAGSGIWAYWSRGGGVSTHFVIADTIYNPKGPHFAGRLERSHPSGSPEDLWCMVHGWPEPGKETKIFVEDEDEGLPRYEKR